MQMCAGSTDTVCPPPHPTDGRWQYEYGLTNIEYTEFERLGILDQPLEGASGSAQLSVFPANTNVLYVGLQAAEAIVQKVGGGRPGATERAVCVAKVYLLSCH